MTMTTEQRLDSIENVLSSVAATLQAVASNHASAETRLTRIETLTEQNSAAIDRLEVQVANITKGLEDSCTDLVRMIGISVEQADQDRAEIRRILDYLFGQQNRNGNGRSDGA